MRQPAPRSRAADALGFVVATALTAGAVATVLGGLVPRVLVAPRALSRPVEERIAFAPSAPAPLPPSREPIPSPPATGVPARRAPGAAPAAGVAPIAAAPRDTAGGGGRRDPARIADGLAPAPTAVPLRAPVIPVPRADDRLAAGLGGAKVVDGRTLGGQTVGLARVPLSRDSAWVGNRARLEQLAMGSRTTSIPLTQEERDAAWRRQSAAMHSTAGVGPAPIATAGVSVGVGLPGGGPSAAQRARDRATHAENVVVLDRIALRADSVCEARRRRVDSLRTVARDERAAAREREAMRGCKG